MKNGDKFLWCEGGRVFPTIWKVVDAKERIIQSAYGGGAGFTFDWTRQSSGHLPIVLTELTELLFKGEEGK